MGKFGITFWQNLQLPKIGRQLQHTEWTDEKHNLYLNFLEASFVEQLHHSRSLYGWGAPVCGSYSSQPLLVNTCSFGDEYMVQQNGCWQKVNFERNKRLLDSTADSHVILRRPQIQNFRAAGKSHAQTSYPHEDCLPCGEGIHLDGNPNNTLGSARSLEQQPGCRLCHQNLVGSTPEVSDQNFVDEDQGETSSTSAPAKRLKTVAADALSSDQVVPLGKVASMDILPVGHPSAENGQAQYEFLAEQSHNFVRPKSELHYFLRGS